MSCGSGLLDARFEREKVRIDVEEALLERVDLGDESLDAELGVELAVGVDVRVAEHDVDVESEADGVEGARQIAGDRLAQVVVLQVDVESLRVVGNGGQLALARLHVEHVVGQVVLVDGLGQIADEVDASEEAFDRPQLLRIDGIESLVQVAHLLMLGIQLLHRVHAAPGACAQVVAHRSLMLSTYQHNLTIHSNNTNQLKVNKQNMFCSLLIYFFFFDADRDNVYDFGGRVAMSCRVGRFDGDPVVAAVAVVVALHDDVTIGGGGGALLFN